MLVDELERARQREQIKRWDEGERRLRDQLKLDVPKRELSADELECWSRFSAWSERKSVRSLPAKPWTVAAYILETAGMGVTHDQILAVVKAIQLSHDAHNFSSPVFSSPALKALDTIVRIEAPRSFSKDEAADWHLVPATIRDAITRVERARSK